MERVFIQIAIGRLFEIYSEGRYVVMLELDNFISVAWDILYAYYIGDFYQ